MRRRVQVLAVLVASGSFAAFAQTDLIQVVPYKTLSIQGKGQFTLFHPSLPLSAVGTSHGLTVFGLDDGRSSEVATCPKGFPITGAASRDGSRLAVACDNGSILITDWEGKSGASLLGRGHTKKITSLGFSPEGTELVSSSEDKTVVVWDLAGKRETNRLVSDPARPFVFAGYTTNGVSIVALTAEGQLNEWDSKSGKSLRKMSLSDNTVLSAALNTAGTLLAIGTEFARMNKFAMNGPASPSNFYREDRLLLYDLTKGAVIKQIDGVDGQLRSLSFSADNRFLAAARQRAKGTYLSIFDLQRGIEVFSQESQDRGVVVGFSQNGKYVDGLTVQGQLAIFKVSGVQMAADVGDLAGQRIRSTSASQLPLLAPGANLNLAIIDLDALHLDKDVGRTVSDMLRNRIVGANVRVVDTARMQEVIKQQNFGFSDRSDPSTAVALGKILNVNKMIYGSVSALGTTYTVNVQLIDVETARVDGIREVTCQRCGLEDLPAVVAELRVLLVGQ